MDNEDRKLHDLLAELDVVPHGWTVVNLKSWMHNTAILEGKPGGTITIDYTYDQQLSFTAAEREQITLDVLSRFRAFLAAEDECCGGRCGR